MSPELPQSSRRAVLGSIGRRSSLSWVGVAAFVLLWSVLSNSGWVSSLLLPSPFRVLHSVADVGTTLVLHVAATVARIAVGFLLGAVVGVAVGMGMQYSRVVFVALDGLVETWRPVPPVALVPFFILLFGFSELGKIFIVTLGVALVLVVTTVEAVERVPVGILRWGLSCGLSRRALFRMVIWPAAWPDMRGGARIALALAVTLVIVSEFMGATYGLGYLISTSKVTLTTPTLLLSVIVLGWLGYGFDRLIRYLFDRTCAWDIRAKGATR